MRKNIIAAAAAAASAVVCLSLPVSAERPYIDYATDYSDKENWAFWNDGEDKEADLFIICPTVDMGDDGNYNSDISNEKIKGDFVGALNMQLGIYSDNASIYSPYYRQATFPVCSLDEDERERYLQIAYEDVRNAFLYYCDNCDESRPLILAGFSQGSDMLIRLMTEFFDDEKYSDRLVASYAIGWSLSEEQTAVYPWLKSAQREDDTGVIVMFNSEAEHITSTPMVGENEHTYSINPLNWKTDSTPADKSLNKGACFTDYDGNITSEVPELTGAYIDEKRGTLKVPDVSEADYPAAFFDEGIFHIYDYQFFYRNLQENVAKRTAAFIAKHGSDTEGAADMELSPDIALTAEADPGVVYVGDEFIVTITARNTGDKALDNVTVYFEDTPVGNVETLAPNEKIKLQIKLKAWESDIESGGIINIFADADGYSKPVTFTFSEKVLPAEPNPATGSDSGVTLVIFAGSAVLAALAKKRR